MPDGNIIPWYRAPAIIAAIIAAISVIIAACIPIIIILNTGPELATVTVQGVVTDNDVKPVIGALVGIDGLSDTTGSGGEYVIPGVPISTNTITVRAHGAEVFKRALRISKGAEIIRYNITLPPVTPRPTPTPTPQITTPTQTPTATAIQTSPLIPTSIPTSTSTPPPTATAIQTSPLIPTSTPTTPPTATPTQTPTLPTLTPPTATPTPTPPLETIDTMDSTSGWRRVQDNMGSTINIRSVPGRTDNGINISYDLEEWGWVLISKEIDPEIISGYDGLRFYYKGSGDPNTIELKLIYEDDTTFGVRWHRATVADNWVTLEAPYSEIGCWGYDYDLDLEEVQRIEFAISNSMEDVYGSGWVVIDDVQGITSPSPTPTPTITPTPSPTPPPPIILTYHDFDLNDVCTLEDNYCGWASAPGNAIVYGSMTTDINVSEGASELEVTISISCNGYGEGLSGPAGSAAYIRVDSEERVERIDSTMNSHHGNYYKYEWCDTFSNTFNVGGKEEITLIIEMSGGARLDFKEAILTFS